MSEAPAGRAALVALAEEEFVRCTGRRPEWRWHVPGRIEIFGKHTDYAGGQSLVAAVPRGFAVVAAPRRDDDLRVIDARHHDEVLIPANDTEPRRGWVNYAAVTVRRLARKPRALQYNQVLRHRKLHEFVFERHRPSSMPRR